jgi:hypothetical protein
VKKNPAHSQNILHVDALEVCITLKERNAKRFVQNWHLPKSFDRMVRILFYMLCSWIIAIFKEWFINGRNCHYLYAHKLYFNA